MKMTKISLLSAAVFSITAGVAQANFLDDSSLSVHLRNLAMKQTNKYSNNTISEKDSWHQWAQGIELNFVSGYIENVIGLDASLYAGLKADRSGIMTDQLLNGDLGNKSYGKLGQAYLKVKLGDKAFGFHGRVGRMVMDQGLMQSSTGRLLPSSFEGVSGTVNIHNVNLYSSYADKISPRTSTTSQDLVNANGDKIDHAYQIGASYDMNNVLADAAYLDSKNYVKQYMINLGYTIPVNSNTSVYLNGNYAHAKQNGNLWDNNGFNDKASHYNLNAQLNAGSVDLMLSYGKTRVDNGQGLATAPARFNYSFAYNDYGYTPSQVSRTISDFMYNGENVWQVQGNYDFSNLGVKGLSAGVTYTKGTHIIAMTNKPKGKEDETDVQVSYAFQQPALNGLSIKLVRAWWNGKNAPVKINNNQYDTMKSDKTDTRLYIDYTISVF